MKKTSKLLKVVSILFIIFGALNFISNLIALAMKDSLESFYEAAGITVPTSSYVIGLAGSIVVIACAIVGIMHKSKKSVLISVIVLFVYYAAIFLYNTVVAGFSALNILSFILPLLYFWGWYLSED